MPLLVYIRNLGLGRDARFYLDGPSAESITSHRSLLGRSVLATVPSDNASTSNSSDIVESNGTSTPTIIACNSISIAACTLTLALYFVLSFRKKYKRLMGRTSLSLAACMAGIDLILHCSNLAGYGPLPSRFACAFVGGWLFAAPTLLSIFYSCCIAFNSQLILVFGHRPPMHALRYYILLPVVLTLIFTLPALATGTFGYDETWGYCWYSTKSVSPSLVLIRMVLTYSLPTLICILYLLFATVTIYATVFGQRSRLGLTSLIRGNEDMSQGYSNRQDASTIPYTYTPKPGYHSPPEQDRELPSLSVPMGHPLSYNSLDISSNSRTSFATSSAPPTQTRDLNSKGFWKYITSNPQTRRVSNRFLRPQGKTAGRSSVPPITPRSFPITPFYPASQVYFSPLSNGNIQNTVPKPGRETPEDDGWRMEKRRDEITARKALTRRQLAIRLIGYIVTPILCLLPGIVLDLLAKISPFQVPDALNGVFDGLNGLIGLLNSGLMLSDPALIAVWMDLKWSLDQQRPISLSEIVYKLPIPRSAKSRENAQKRSSREEVRHQKKESDMLTSGFGVGVHTRLEEIGEEGEVVDQEERMVFSPDDKQEDHEAGVKEEPITSYPPEARTTTSRYFKSIKRTQNGHHRLSNDAITREGSPLQVRIQVDIEVTRAKRQKEVELVEDWLAGL